MLRLWNRKLNQQLFCSLPNTQLYKFNLKCMSGGHGNHESDSEHEHGHSDHSDHEGNGHNTHSENYSENEIFYNNARSRIFKNNTENFSVEKLLQSVKAPLNDEKIKVDKRADKLFDTEQKYIDFLATNFEKKALEKYPNYKDNLNELKFRIKNFDQFNKYQQEVVLLDTYMYWQLEKQEQEIRTVYDVSGTTLEQAKKRLEFFESNYVF